MGAVAFIQLQKAFSQEQVEALANFVDTQAATKADLSEVKAELKADIAAVKAELKAEIADIKADLKLMEHRMTIKLGGMLVVIFGAAVAAAKYLPGLH